MDLAEQEEKQNGVVIASLDLISRGMRKRCLVKVLGEELEGEEEVASDEEGFAREGEGVEVVEGEGEEDWGGDDGGDTPALVVGE